MRVREREREYDRERGGERGRDRMRERKAFQTKHSLFSFLMEGGRCIKTSPTKNVLFLFFLQNFENVSRLGFRSMQRCSGVVKN